MVRIRVIHGMLWIIIKAYDRRDPDLRFAPSDSELRGVFCLAALGVSSGSSISEIGSREERGRGQRVSVSVLLALAFAYILCVRRRNAQQITMIGRGRYGYTVAVPSNCHIVANERSFVRREVTIRRRRKARMIYIYDESGDRQWQRKVPVGRRW